MIVITCSLMNICQIYYLALELVRVFACAVVGELRGKAATTRGWGKCLKVTLQNVCRKICASVNGGLSGGSRVRRPGNEDPHRR